MSGQQVPCSVILLGDNAVGKTVLLRRYIDQAYPQELPNFTVGVDFVIKSMNVGGRNVQLKIWDTAGAERYDSLTRVFCRGANAAIVCYSVTDRNSFEKVKFWVNELQNIEEHCRIYICGTKIDLTENDKNGRQVDFHEVQDYADGIKAHLCEISSKTGHSVDELFQKVVEDFVNYRNLQVQTEPKGVDLTQKRDLDSRARCHQ